jgi:hypothetical protein
MDRERCIKRDRGWQLNQEEADHFENDDDVALRPENRRFASLSSVVRSLTCDDLVPFDRSLAVSLYVFLLDSDGLTSVTEMLSALEKRAFEALEIDEENEIEEDESEESSSNGGHDEEGVGVEEECQEDVVEEENSNTREETEGCELDFQNRGGSETSETPTSPSAPTTSQGFVAWRRGDVVRFKLLALFKSVWPVLMEAVRAATQVQVNGTKRRRETQLRPTSSPLATTAHKLPVEMSAGNVSSFECGSTDSSEGATEVTHGLSRFFSTLLGLSPSSGISKEKSSSSSSSRSSSSSSNSSRAGGVGGNSQGADGTSVSTSSTAPPHSNSSSSSSSQDFHVTQHHRNSNVAHPASSLDSAARAFMASAIVRIRDEATHACTRVVSPMAAATPSSLYTTSSSAAATAAADDDDDGSNVTSPRSSGGSGSEVVDQVVLSAKCHQQATLPEKENELHSGSNRGNSTTSRGSSNVGVSSSLSSSSSPSLFSPPSSSLSTQPLSAPSSDDDGDHQRCSNSGKTNEAKVGTCERRRLSNSSSDGGDETSGHDSESADENNGLLVKMGSEEKKRGTRGEEGRGGGECDEDSAGVALILSGVEAVLRQKLETGSITQQE